MYPAECLDAINEAAAAARRETLEEVVKEARRIRRVTRLVDEERRTVVVLDELMNAVGRLAAGPVAGEAGE